MPLMDIEETLTDGDLMHIASRGCTIDQVKEQLTTFSQGIPYLTLDRPCTLGDGLLHLQSKDMEKLHQTFERAKRAGRVSKFVPASGAATRMFKSLMPFLGKAGTSSYQPPELRTDPLTVESNILKQFLTGLKRFAFYDDLCRSLSQQHQDINTLLAREEMEPILEHLLSDTGLNYAKLPKGLLKFHYYADGSRTPIEEHIIEAETYALDDHHQVRVHFTISPDHHQAIMEHIETIRKKFSNRGVEHQISCSFQHRSTDTIAVDIHNKPFRDREGKLLFRPAGHGALLANLNDLKADLVFIKNIDNVVPDHLKEETYIYKRAMGGLLVSLQEQIGTHLSQLTDGFVSECDIQAIATFAQERLYLNLPEDWRQWGRQQRILFLIRKLHRPIRICGMVKNTGDPGGGPFWVKHDDGTHSLQIVETSQVNPNCAQQQEFLRRSTHFNPVDMICAIRDYRGQDFDLFQFQNPHTGFISQKSHEGRDLKALELPGLWNGGMADWITVFVEIPRSTFNPVKTVFDLLHPKHQPA